MGSNYEQIKERLLARKRVIEEGMERLVEARKAVESEDVQDPLDQALKSSLDDLNISLEEHERSELERIEAALARLEKGIYGVCVDCHKPISPRRLELYPNATCCIACQEQRERH